MKKPKPPIVPIVLAVVLFGAIITVNQLNSPRVAQPEPQPQATTPTSTENLKGEMAGAMQMTAPQMKPQINTTPKPTKNAAADPDREKRSAEAAKPAKPAEPTIPTTTTSSQWFDEDSAIR